MLSRSAVSSRISPGSRFQTTAANSGRIKQDKKGCLASSDSPGKLENHIDKTGRNRASEVARATAPVPEHREPPPLKLPLSLLLLFISSRSKSKSGCPIDWVEDLPTPCSREGWGGSARHFVSPRWLLQGVSSQ